MKFSLLFFLVIVFLGVTNFKVTQKKYLPVYIGLSDTSFLSKELLLNIKAAFSMKKVKTINRSEIMELQDAEVRRVMIPYFEIQKTSNDPLNFDDGKRYMATHQQNIANSLYINLKVNAAGFIEDTVKWSNHTLPINMLDFPKPKLHYMILDSTNAKTMLQMSQSIVDSIIASNVLIKD
ncbi:MAG: hypothetical protein ABIR78_06955 [Ferruginibacter sp.]